MAYENLTFEAIVFVVILLSSLFIFKLDNIISVVLAFVGFGIVYYFMEQK